VKRAIYPGTFDPITCGHLDIIERASSLFDELVIAAIDIPAHKKKTLFDIDERLELIEKSTGHLPNIQISKFDELVVEYAKRIEAHALVRGLRAITDFEYEMQINQLNHHQAPEIESVYLMTSPQYSFISSSGVREMALFKGHIEGLVPEPVVTALRAKFAD